MVCGLFPVKENKQTKACVNLCKSLLLVEERFNSLPEPDPLHIPLFSLWKVNNEVRIVLVRQMDKENS